MECEADYYLDDSTKQCIKNPKPLISNCKIYKDEVNCEECENKYKKVDNKCVEIETIENCLEYDGSVNYDSCKKCENNYYLNDNLCLERTKKSISKCEIFKVD